MNKFSLDKEMEIEVKATFIAKGNDTPVSGELYTLRMYDNDIFGEDFMGESKLNEAGEGRIAFSHDDLRQAFKGDILPDFYFVLYNDGIPVFQSKVIQGLDPQTVEQYQRGEGEVVDLGTYLVDDYKL